MATNRKGYFAEYRKEKLHRVPLDLTKEKYSEVKAAAARSGSSVNGYIKTAINEKIDREKE